MGTTVRRRGERRRVVLKKSRDKKDRRKLGIKGEKKTKLLA
jgi:hypothetical protein